MANNHVGRSHLYYCWEEDFKDSLPCWSFLKLSWHITTTWWLKPREASFPTVVEDRNPRPRCQMATFPLKTRGEDFWSRLLAPEVPDIPWLVAASLTLYVTLALCVCSVSLSFKDTLIGFGKWKSLSRVWLFAPWRTIQSWNSPGQNTGVDCHSLLQGIFPTQGWNPGLPHCRQIPYQLSHQGNPFDGYLMVFIIIVEISDN